MTGLLAEQLASDTIVLAPGVFDGLSALVAERAGAQAVYLSGASIAYTKLGQPDIGLVSVTEVAATLGQICDRISAPVIVDADTGFGNALNTARTVREFERLGAAGVQLEDQTLPKRCGHLTGKTLISTAEMSGKIKAATDARHSTSTLIVARTDAIGVEGLDAALDRAEQYVDAGADVLFIEAPTGLEDMQRIVNQFASRLPLLANMVEGGNTPMMSAAELQRIGYSLVIFPGGLVRALAPVMQRFYSSLLAHGSSRELASEMMDFAGINQLLGTADMLELGARYDSAAITVSKQEEST